MLSVEADHVTARGQSYSSVHSLNFVTEITEGPCKGLKIPIFGTEINYARAFEIKETTEPDVAYDPEKDVTEKVVTIKKWGAILSNPPLKTEMRTTRTSTKEVCIAFSQFCPLHGTNLHPAKKCKRYMDQLRDQMQQTEGWKNSMGDREEKMMQRNDEVRDKEKKTNAWFDKNFGAGPSGTGNNYQIPKSKNK